MTRRRPCEAGLNAVRWPRASTLKPVNEMTARLFLLSALTAAFGTVGATGQTPVPPPVACHAEASSLLGRSASGIEQVGNLKLIQLQCGTSPRRPLPTTGSQGLLTVEATVYQLSASGSRMLVRSAVAPSGGGGDQQTEWVNFSLDIPIDDAERDAAVTRYIDQFVATLASSSNALERAEAERLRSLGSRGTDQLALGFRQMFQQHRAGRFHMDVRLLDGGRVVNTGGFDFEVVFKGSFFEEYGRRTRP